jgi:tRNA(Arg) A34 adenosine deaminase TadA
MKNQQIFNYFQIAGLTAVSKDDRRSFLLCALGIRSDGVLVKSLNGPTEKPNAEIHAERRLSKKLDYNAIVYVARVRLDTKKFGLSRPCRACMSALISKKVKRVYYTINANQYGVWLPNTDEDYVYSFSEYREINLGLD